MANKKEDSEFTKLCKDLEHYETPEWVIRAVLKKEILSKAVLDPCCGNGIISEVLESNYYTPVPIDVKNWGYSKTLVEIDFLQLTPDLLLEESDMGSGFSVMMNPPFSLAEKFVEKAFELGARKVLCFQRFSWYEGSFDTGKKRGKWWEKNRPSRIWLCGDRASCWRHDLPVDKDGDRTDHEGKKLAEASTSHAWFVWERGHAPAALTGHIFRKDAE